MSDPNRSALIALNQLVPSLARKWSKEKRQVAPNRQLGFRSSCRASRSLNSSWSIGNLLKIHKNCSSLLTWNCFQGPLNSWFGHRRWFICVAHHIPSRQISLQMIWRKRRTHHPHKHFLGRAPSKAWVIDPSCESWAQRLPRRRVLLSESRSCGLVKTDGVRD